jgi:hypothetical protein
LTRPASFIAFNESIGLTADAAIGDRFCVAVFAVLAVVFATLAVEFVVVFAVFAGGELQAVKTSAISKNKIL